MKKFFLKITFAILITIAVMAGIGALFGVINYNEIKLRYNGVFFRELKSVNSDITKLMANQQKNEENYSLALSKTHTYSFSDIVILTKDGAVVYSSSEQIDGSFIEQSGMVSDIFFKEEGDSYIYENDGEKVVLILPPDDGFSDVRIMGIMPYAIYSDVIYQNVLYNVFQVISLFFAAVAGSVFIVMTFKHRYDTLVYVKPVNNFILKVSNRGKILSCDSEFRKKFAIDNLSPYLTWTKSAFELELISGRNMLFDLPDRQGSLVKLVCAATSTVGGYKLVCSDMSAFINEYEKLKISALTSVDGVWNEKKLVMDWKSFIKEKKYAKGLMVFFQILNKDFYSILFGAGNMRSFSMVYAQNLKSLMNEYGLIYSIESGELVLFVTDDDKKQTFLKKLNEISEKVNLPLTIDNQVIKLDTRIGVIPLDSAEEETELDAVIFVGKKAIKNASLSERLTYYVLRAASFDNAKRDLATKEGVMELMNNGGIEVYFQPQYDIVNNKVVGMEALCRISGERAKEITVADFVEAAEETGQIVEMGRFIYEKAMDFAKLLKNEEVRISINVSPIQLMQTGFVEAFLSAYKMRGLEDNSIDIEIVENTFIGSISDVTKKLVVLKNNGINAQIDDFGIAYSSIYYLKKMPVSTLKIDKAFVDGLGVGEMDNMIVKNIINLANDLGLNTIAEGVETQAQAEILKEMGCTVIQGYYIGKAMNKEKAYAFIKEKNS